MALPIRRAQKTLLSNASISPGLQRITKLLATTPTPWKAIHVAGTNGKGSVCNYVSQMLDEYNQSYYRLKMRQSKIRHGRFTSPHLIDRWDCITIDGHPISKALFLELEGLLTTRSEHAAIDASPFELLTATAFTAFTETKLDVAVIEVGMGGREDATNVIGQDVSSYPTSYTFRDGEVLPVPSYADFRPQPLVTAICKIGLDHQDFLGLDLRSIAIHKAGIVKPHSPFVYDTTNAPETIEVIRQQPNSIGHADWRGLFGDSSVALKQTEHVLNSSYQDRAPHVQVNATVALRSIWTALVRLGDRVPVHDQTFLRFVTSTSTSTQQEHSASSSSTWTSDHSDLLDAMLRAPLRTQIPGRQERLNLQSLTGIPCPILLDGAHNDQSIKALSEQLQKLRSSRSFTSEDSDAYLEVSESFNKGSVTRPSNTPVLAEPSPPAKTGKITFILAFSASKSKSITSMLQQILRPGDDVHLVEFSTPVDGMPWVQSAQSTAIAQKVNNLGLDLDKVRDWKTDVGGALRHVAERWRDGDAGHVVVAGSLYLVGDVYRLMRQAGARSEGDEEE